VDRINIDISIHSEKHADGTQTAHIKRIIHFEGSLTDDQKERMLQIADKCPTHRLLTNQIEIETNQV